MLQTPCPLKMFELGFMPVLVLGCLTSFVERGKVVPGLAGEYRSDAGFGVGGSLSDKIIAHWPPAEDHEGRVVIVGG